MVRNNWTDEELEKLQGRLLVGETVAEIANHYQVTSRAIYEVMERNDIKAPRYVDTNLSLSPSERYLMIRLGHKGPDINLFLPLPDYCAISGRRLVYRAGMHNSAMPVNFRGEEWLVVTKDVYELLTKYTQGDLRKVIEWYDKR